MNQHALSAAAPCLLQAPPGPSSAPAAELVLATKEANKKSRTVAYELLVATAHALDAADDGKLPWGLLHGGASHWASTRWLQQVPPPSLLSRHVR